MSLQTILIVSPHLPYKNVGHAGGKNIYEFIVSLKKRGFKVYLLSLVLPEEEKELPGVRDLCDDVHFLISKPVFSDSLFNSLLRNPFFFAFQLSKAAIKYFRIRRGFRFHLRRLTRLYNLDIIQVEYTSMATYLSKVGSKGLTVLHLHDVMFKPVERMFRTEKQKIRRILGFLFFVITREMEISFCRKFDKLLVLSECDRDLLLKRGDFDIEVFTLGIERAPWTPGYKEREAQSILFVGAMDREVNEKAVLYFIREVMPRLEKKIGKIKFYVVGKSPSAHLLTMRRDNVEITGFVEDVGRFYRNCQVFVAPLFFGGGMIFKVIQAMSFGLPVVSSTVANEGVLARQNEEILIADTPEEFCDKIASLLENGILWNDLSKRARSFVETNYSWDVVTDDYLKYCQDDHARGNILASGTISSTCLSK